MEPERHLRTADTEADWLELLRSDEPYVIRSREDWDALIADEERRRTVLRNCDDATVNAFTEGLIFRNGGLAGANYSMLVDVMTVSEFRTLWNNFGIGERLFPDYDNKECTSPHTCSDHNNWICTHNC